MPDASGRRRVRLPLADGAAHMDVCLEPGASQETIDALRALGEAAAAQMINDQDDAAAAGEETA